MRRAAKTGFCRVESAAEGDIESIDNQRITRSDALPNLDVLRALAVFLVLADHTHATLQSVYASDFDPSEWTDLGRAGVLFFFVHTARVLMASLERSSAAHLVRDFYLRRVFRIYPLAIVCILIVVLLGVPFAPWMKFAAPTSAALAANLSLTMNLTATKSVLAPLWTLPIEVQMYLALPFIFLITRRANDFGRIAILSGLSLVAAWVLHAIATRLYGAMYAPCFMAGIVAYALGERIAPRLSGILWPVFLLVVVAVYAGVESLLEGFDHFLVQDALCLVLACALPLFRQSTCTPLNRAAHVLARYSFGVYLFHMIALWIGIYSIRPPSLWLGALLALLLVVGMSVAGYHFIEAPAIRLGARLARKWAGDGA